MDASLSLHGLFLECWAHKRMLSWIGHVFAPISLFACMMSCLFALIPAEFLHAGFILAMAAEDHIYPRSTSFRVTLNQIAFPYSQSSSRCDTLRFDLCLVRASTESAWISPPSPSTATLASSPRRLNIWLNFAIGVLQSSLLLLVLGPV